MSLRRSKFKANDLWIKNQISKKKGKEEGRGNLTITAKKKKRKQVQRIIRKSLAFQKNNLEVENLSSKNLKFINYS